jgi:hypothetical protein
MKQTVGDGLVQLTDQIQRPESTSDIGLRPYTVLRLKAKVASEPCSAEAVRESSTR